MQLKPTGHPISAVKPQVYATLVVVSYFYLCYVICFDKFPDYCYWPPWEHHRFLMHCVLCNVHLSVFCDLTLYFCVVFPG